MDNQLVPQGLTEGALAAYNFDDVVAGSGTYLPRLQLFGSRSDACATGDISIGHYGLVKDGTIVDLGEELNAVVVSWRPKALQIDGDNIITEYNPETELYQKIKSLSFVSDSGCMYGPEFLLWISDQEQFATYFMSSKTARREAKKVGAFLKKAVTFKCKLIETARYKWHGPVVIRHTAPLDVPPLEVMQVAVDTFQNPLKSNVELAPESEEERVR